jgi:hypothetical protein
MLTVILEVSEVVDNVACSKHCCPLNVTENAFFQVSSAKFFAGSVAPCQMLIEISIHLSAVHVTGFDFIR